METSDYESYNDKQPILLSMSNFYRRRRRVGQ